MNAADLTAFAAATLATASTVFRAYDKRDGRDLEFTCTVELLEVAAGAPGRIRVRLAHNFFVSGKRAHKFAVASLEAVFAALKSEGLAFRVCKRWNPHCSARTVWQHATSGSGLSWGVDAQYADVEILGSAASVAAA